jgi:hypothetical protein
LVVAGIDALTLQTLPLISDIGIAAVGIATVEIVVVGIAVIGIAACTRVTLRYPSNYSAAFRPLTGVL